MATHSRRVLHMTANSTLMFALNAIHSTLANKKCWTQPVESTNSAANMVCLNNKSTVIGQILKNALNGRFFIPALIILSSTSGRAEMQGDGLCVSTHFDEKAFINYVIDGDTVVLNDKRHIRLIGINTPEINRNDMPSEEGALLARQTLIDILQDQTEIRLVYGKERHDRHGRTLAHLYLRNGSNVQARLLFDGLAMPLRIPPNIDLADCYERASQHAKAQSRGLWAFARYKTHDVSSLTGSERGFYFISGKVRYVSESKTSTWINLENNVALRIKKEDLHYFNKARLKSLAGKTIEANGWLYKNNKQLRIRLRHELDLKILQFK